MRCGCFCNATTRCVRFFLINERFRSLSLTYIFTYLLTYLLTPCSRVPLQKLTGSQLVKKFLAFYGNRRFITAFLSQLDSVHIPTSHFLMINLNIIFPSTPRSPKWSLSVRFPHQNPVYVSLLPHTRYMPRPSNSSRFNHPKNIR